MAVAAGTYVETIAMDSGHDGVRLVGRCKELAIIDGGGGGDEDPAVEVLGDRRRPDIGETGAVASRSRMAPHLWRRAAQSRTTRVRVWPRMTLDRSSIS